MFRLSRATSKTTCLFRRFLATEAPTSAASGSSDTSTFAMERLASEVSSEVTQNPANPVASTSHLPAPLLSQSSVPSVPAQHGCHVATLQFRSYTVARPQLDMAVEFARRAAHALKIPVGAPASLPISTELLTVPRGPFVHKKSQENFWRRTHRRAVKVWDADEKVVQVWLEYLRQNPIPGVGIKVQQLLYRPVGFGQDIKDLSADSTIGSSQAPSKIEGEQKSSQEQANLKAQ